MLPPRRRNLAALVAVGALVVAGCGGDDGGAQPTPTEAPTTAPSTTTGATDQPTPDAPAESEGGQQVSPDDTQVTSDDTGTDTDTDNGSDEAEFVPSAPEILQVTAPLIGGGELDLATLADRPLLLWFWSPF